MTHVRGELARFDAQTLPVRHVHHPSQVLTCLLWRGKVTEEFFEEMKWAGQILCRCWRGR